MQAAKPPGVTQPPLPSPGLRMIISHDQLRKLREAAALRRGMRILEFLRERYPGSVAGLETSAALERIRWGLGWIQRAGVHDGKAAALFVVMQFAAGPTFYLHPRCQALLTDRRLPPDARVMSMFCADMNIPWDDIAAQRDDDAWPRFGDDAMQGASPAARLAG